MPLRGVEGRLNDWCCCCKATIPKHHKTLRIHLNRAHCMELLPGCPLCFFFRLRWSDIKKHCFRQHILDIDAAQGNLGCTWGLTQFDMSCITPTYASVGPRDICHYPLLGETLTTLQEDIIAKGEFRAPSAPWSSLGTLFSGSGNMDPKGGEHFHLQNNLMRNNEARPEGVPTSHNTTTISVCDGSEQVTRIKTEPDLDDSEAQCLQKDLPTNQEKPASQVPQSNVFELDTKPNNLHELSVSKNHQTENIETNNAQPGPTLSLESLDCNKSIVSERYSCKICNFTCAIFPTLSQHYKQEHLIEIPQVQAYSLRKDSLDYVCVYCGKAYLSRIGLLCHMKKKHAASNANHKRTKQNNHNDHPGVVCQICQIPFTKVSTFRRHYRNFHPDMEIPVPGPQIDWSKQNVEVPKEPLKGNTKSKNVALERARGTEKKQNICNCQKCTGCGAALLHLDKVKKYFEHSVKDVLKNSPVLKQLQTLIEATDTDNVGNMIQEVIKACFGEKNADHEDSSSIIQSEADVHKKSKNQVFSLKNVPERASNDSASVDKQAASSSIVQTNNTLSDRATMDNNEIYFSDSDDCENNFAGLTDLDLNLLVEEGNSSDAEVRPVMNGTLYHEKNDKNEETKEEKKTSLEVLRSPAQSVVGGNSSGKRLSVIFECFSCKCAFKSNKLMKKHVEECSDHEKSYKCSGCGKAFCHKSSVYRHLREIHNSPVLPQKERKLEDEVDTDEDKGDICDSGRRTAYETRLHQGSSNISVPVCRELSVRLVDITKSKVFREKYPRVLEIQQSKGPCVKVEEKPLQADKLGISRDGQQICEKSSDLTPQDVDSQSTKVIDYHSSQSGEISCENETLQMETSKNDCKQSPLANTNGLEDEHDMDIDSDDNNDDDGDELWNPLDQNEGDLLDNEQSEDDDWGMGESGSQKGRDTENTDTGGTGNILECQECHKKYPNKKSLKTHLYVVHSVCRVCEMSFANANELKEHTKTHRHSLQCEFCKEVCKSMRSLRKHHQQHKEHLKDECKICNKKTRKMHLCEICGATFRELYYYRKHLHSHHPNHSQASLNKPVSKQASKVSHMCEYCGKVLSSRYNLRAHYTSFHFEKIETKLQAEDIVPESNEEISEDQQVSEDGVSQSVKKRSANTSSSDQLLRNEMPPSKIFSCKFCHKIFGRRDSLITHMRRHTDERPFECPICHRRFTQRTSRNVHAKVHTGERYAKYEKDGRVCKRRKIYATYHQRVDLK